MNRKLLPKNFFKDNPLEEISTAKLAYFSMTIMWDDRELGEQMQDKAKKNIDPERAEQIEAEKVQISKLESGNDTVKFIRVGYDFLNRDLLCEKILTMQAEVLPLLLRRFRTSGQDMLIETAGHVLAHAEPVYIDQLISMYSEIRNPYAQSMACLVFGIQKREEMLPLLLREYERLGREYPEESYDQGPLLAIYILFGEA